MELCNPPAFSNLPNQTLLTFNHTHFQWKPLLLLNKSPKSRFNSGLFYRMSSSIRSASEESSSFTSVKETEAYELYVPPEVEKKETQAYELYVPPTVEKNDNGASQSEAPNEDSRKDKEIEANESLVYEPPKVEEKDSGAVQTEAPIEASGKDQEIDANESLIYEPPEVEEKNDGAVQTEAPIEASGKDKEIDANESLIYEPPEVEEKDDGAVQTEAPVEASGKDKEIDASESLIYEPPEVEEKDDGAVQTEAPIEYSSVGIDSQLPEFIDNLNIKFDSEDSSSVFLVGGGAIVALWLTTAIVGSIDSVPLFPKLLEVVGLGYTLWFSTRFLLFKKNRDELADKFEELKQKVLGTNE